MSGVVSFKAEVVADSSGEFVGNSLRFETRKLAEVYAQDLAMRWTLVSDWRVVESTDPVTESSRRATKRVANADG